MRRFGGTELRAVRGPVLDIGDEMFQWRTLVVPIPDVTTKIISRDRQVQWCVKSAVEALSSRSQINTVRVESLTSLLFPTMRAEVILLKSSCKRCQTWQVDHSHTFGRARRRLVPGLAGRLYLSVSAPRRGL